MKGLVKNITQIAEDNTYFRQVMETGKHTQIVVMSIPPGGDIGEEVHTDNDQVLYLVKGQGKAILNGEEQAFDKNDIILVNAGVTHNFINIGTDDLKIITTYAPPHHPAGTIHKTKEEAEAAHY